MSRNLQYKKRENTIAVWPELMGQKEQKKKKNREKRIARKQSEFS